MAGHKLKTKKQGRVTTQAQARTARKADQALAKRRAGGSSTDRLTGRSSVAQRVKKIGRVLSKASFRSPVGISLAIGLEALRSKPKKIAGAKERRKALKNRVI